MNSEAYKEMRDAEATHWWYVARRKIISQMISLLQLPTGSSILEIGAGTGGNLGLLSQFGQVKGLEMDDYACSIANERFGGFIRVKKGMCPEDLFIFNEKFDLICLFDVLEHIKDDVNALKEIGSVMKRDGYLVLTVPAYMWLWGLHDEILHHQRRYVRKELISIAEKVGFRVERITYFNTVLFPLVVIGRAVDKMFHRKKATGLMTPVSIINKSLEFLFGLERVFLEKADLPFGVSIVCVLRKVN